MKSKWEYEEEEEAEEAAADGKQLGLRRKTVSINS